MTAPARLFDIGGTAWEVTNRADPITVGRADRHYPRRKRGHPTVGGPGKIVVLRSVDWTASWISLYTIHPDDGLDAWRCTMFRNEGAELSSTLILDAMAVTAAMWGQPPPDGWCTYVDTAKIASPNPGYCFKRAGWWLDRTYRPDRRRASLIRLRCSEAALADPAG